MIKAAIPQELLFNEIKGSMHRRASFPDFTTLRFVASRPDSEYQYHQIECRDHTGRRWVLPFFLKNYWGAWHVKSSSAWFETPKFPWPVETKPKLAQLGYNISGPMVARIGPGAFSGEGREYLASPGSFYAYGRVSEDVAEGTRVVMTDPDGKVLEDVVRQQVLIFASEALLRYPLQLDFYNQAGQLVGQQIEPKLGPGLF